MSWSICRTGSWPKDSPPRFRLAREIVPNVNRISAALRSAGGLVIYIQNTIDAAAKDGMVQLVHLHVR